MLASVTMCNDDIRNYNSKISDLGPLTIIYTTLKYHALLLAVTYALKGRSPIYAYL